MNFDHLLPEQMQSLEKDERGFPVPFTVFRDKSNKPTFRINDDQKTLLCVKQKLCIICGKPLNGDMWFIGGQLSAFHPRGAFNDAPVHKCCGIFALKVCPYMAYSRYKRKGNIDFKDFDIPIFLDPTQTEKRLTFFCFVKASSYTYEPEAIHPVYTTKKPYLQIEYWLDGQEISHQTAVNLLRVNREHNYLPKLKK